MKKLENLEQKNIANEEVVMIIRVNEMYVLPIFLRTVVLSDWSSN